MAPVEPITGLRVLLVEDDAAVRSILERGLKRAGVDVVAAADAVVALGHLDSDAPVDVLVSDVMMPGMDGVELASRALALRPGLAIVLMSGFAEPPLHRAANAQGVRFLAKPFALTDLVAAIAAAQPGPR
jgi:CheY-like chemotaxis protein